ncbi:MAG: fumarylacetoacetate hydrolase family protein [bacterium]|nr:fumarylacetoacetate hydrolase family protein [bacterium]
MKLLTYDLGKNHRAGLAVDGMIADIEKAARALLGGKLPPAVRPLLAAGEGAWRTLRALDRKVTALAGQVRAGRARRPAWLLPEDAVHLCPPVPDPEKVVCLGLNYLDHIQEQEGRLHKSIEAPENPIIFAKFASTLTGPYDTIRLPPLSVTKQVDYEVELALVIGRTMRDVTQKDALAHVAGYMVMNDVSARDCQFGDKQWVRGKSFDGFAPCGPWLVTPDELGDPHRLRLRTVLNGQTMQDGSTRNFLFKLPRVLSYLSRSFTFKPGDILTTGTPAGVGIFRDPPVVLKPGDTVECTIEGIGTLCNTCECG